jgi:hypothetical protein
LAALALALSVSLVSPVVAFDLKPAGTDVEKLKRLLKASSLPILGDELASLLVDHFSTPVHEEITNLIYGCAPPIDCRLPSPSFASAAVLFGVQWNDNPPFALTASSLTSCPVGTRETIRLPLQYSGCWLSLYKDAKKRASAGARFTANSDIALIYRVHFGDLQFLHAMASWDGEAARDTRQHILMWLEFTYRVAVGQIGSSVRVRESGVAGMDHAFVKKEWTVENMFTLGDETFRSADSIRGVAFGAFLHTIEDSFAAGHVERDVATEECGNGNKEAGKILNFHSYSHQNARRHGDLDTRSALQAQMLSGEPNVVSVGKELRAMYVNGVPWSSVSEYLEQCVFAVADPDVPSDPGDAFKE